MKVKTLWRAAVFTTLIWITISCSGDPAYRPFFIHKYIHIHPSKIIGNLKEINIIPGANYIPDPHFASILKMNLIHALHNSGKFLAVTDQENIPLEPTEEALTITAEVHPRLESRIHKWATFLSIIPFPFIGPLQQKSSCATVELQLKFYKKDNNFALVRVVESVPYFVRFYALYDTTEDERAMSRAYKKVLHTATNLLRNVDLQKRDSKQTIFNEDYRGCRRLSPYAK